MSAIGSSRLVKSSKGGGKEYELHCPKAGGRHHALNKQIKGIHGTTGKMAKANSFLLLGSDTKTLRDLMYLITYFTRATTGFGVSTQSNEEGGGGNGFVHSNGVADTVLQQEEKEKEKGETGGKEEGIVEREDDTGSKLLLSDGDDDESSKEIDGDAECQPRSLPENDGSIPNDQAITPPPSPDPSLRHASQDNSPDGGSSPTDSPDGVRHPSINHLSAPLPSASLPDSSPISIGRGSRSVPLRPHTTVKLEMLPMRYEQSLSPPFFLSLYFPLPLLSLFPSSSPHNLYKQ